MKKEHGQKYYKMPFSLAPPSLLGEREGEDRRETVTKQGETHRHRVLPSPEVFQDTHLKLPQGVVTLLLPRGLLGTQHDKLIDALCHSSRAGTEKNTGLGVTASSYYFMWWHISAFSSAEVRTDYLGCGPHEASSTSSLYTTPIKHTQGRGKADSLPYFWLFLWFLKGSNSSLKKLGLSFEIFIRDNKAANSKKTVLTPFSGPSSGSLQGTELSSQDVSESRGIFWSFSNTTSRVKSAKDFKSLLSGTECVDD